LLFCGIFKAELCTQRIAVVLKIWLLNA